MNKGILIYAHNSRELDYLDLAVVSGHLATKNLKVPASLVTDKSTFEWAKTSNKLSQVNAVFENIIFSEDFANDNYRSLHDGVEAKSTVPFLNKDRCSAWHLTPYDRTLLIDSDFLILSNHLANYWDTASEFLIADSALDTAVESRLEYHDRYISDVGIKMKWATTIMFTKNQSSKIIFDLVEFIRDNYSYFSDLYRFSAKVFRNDITFSIALHILNGNNQFQDYSLPAINTFIDKDVLIDTKDDSLFFLISSKFGDTYNLCSKKNQDIHIMNKQSIVRNKHKLLDLI